MSEYSEKTPLQKANYAKDSKDLLITALNNKGFEIQSSDSFRSIPNKITSNTMIIDTSLFTSTATYTSTNFVLDQETGYYEFSGSGSGILNISFNIPSTSNIILNYSGNKTMSGESMTTVILDGSTVDYLSGTSIYEDFIIENVPSGNHIIKIDISSAYSDTSLSIKAILPNESGITSDKVLDGYVGYVEGQKITGSYIPIDISEEEALAKDILGEST